MFKKITLTLIALIAAASISNAQGFNVAKAYGYSPLFVEGVVGANAVYDAKTLTSFTPGGQIAIGYQFLPQVLIRGSVQLGSAKPLLLNDGWFTESTFFRAGVAFDIAWDIINTVDEDNVKDFYHIQPYLRFQEMFGIAKEKSVAVFVAGAGLRNTFRLSDRLDAVLDLNAVLSSERKWHQSAGFFVFLYTGAGIAYKF